MSYANLIPINDMSGCPFPFFNEPLRKGENIYKIYNDGGHYIATIATRPSSSFARITRKLNRGGYKKGYKEITAHSEREDIDILFDSLYKTAMQDGVKADDLTAYIKAGIIQLFPDYDNLDGYIADKIERKRHNLYARKKRFRRKANLNRWNYFVTFTYDDSKQDADSFRAKLRKCSSNLHTRRGWRYMGVFERAPETGRLHFHGLLYIPDGELIGTITEKTDYSTAQGKMQTTHENDFFQKYFGRNDFEELNEMEMKHGQTLNYLLKYIGKTGERIIYSRGIPAEIYRKVNDNDIVTEMQDFGTKYILFDNVISWERDIMHFKRKQVTIIDLMCNPLRVA